MADERFALIIDVDARRGRQEVRGLGRDMQVASGQASRHEAAMAKFQGRIVAMGGALAGLQLAKKVIDIAASFETLQTQLETVEGSVRRAERSFALLKDFSARTPFQIQNLTESWINLRAKGFEPTIGTMQAIGNMAAAFGKDVTQATQAVTQAAFGEAEMLKQFGIIMRQQGDSVKITFRGVTQEIERDSQAIFDALTELAEVNFAGGMERQAETLTGKLSTLKDILAQIADTLAKDSGGFDFLKDSLGAINSILNSRGFKVLLAIGTQGTLLNLIPREITSGEAEAALEPVNQQLENIGAALADIEQIQAKIRLAEIDLAINESEQRVDQLTEAYRERLRLIREEYEWAVRLKALRAEADAVFLAQVDSRIGAAPFDIPEVADTFSDEFTQQVMEDLPPAVEPAASRFAEQVGFGLEHILANVVNDLFNGRSIDGAALFGDIGSVVGQAIGGPFAAAVLGGLGQAFGSALFGGNDFVERFVGSVDVFGVAVAEFADAQIATRDMVLRLENALGASIFGDTHLDFTEIAPGEFRADFGNIASGFGASIDEAARDAMDAFASAISSHIALGNIDLSGVAPEIVAALSESVFGSFDDMVSQIGAWDESLNSVATTLGAVTVETDPTLNRLRELERQITRSGLSAERAAPFLEELTKAMDIRRQQLTAGFFIDIADIMDRAGINASKAAAFRAAAEQKIVQLKLIELEITARSLGLWTEAWAALFDQLNAWAANINNFVVATARITAPVIRSAPRIGGGGGGGRRGTPNGDRLRDFLRGLDYQAPGTPMASKTGLAAAMAAMQSAARSRNADAFIEAANEALRTHKEIFGSLGLSGLREQIKAMGAFTPNEARNPVVGAINNLGTSLGGSFDTLNAAVDELPPEIAEEVGEEVEPLVPDPPPDPPTAEDIGEEVDAAMVQAANTITDNLGDQLANIAALIQETNAAIGQIQPPSE